jgi:hypothetical protein
VAVGGVDVTFYLGRSSSRTKVFLIIALLFSCTGLGDPRCLFLPSDRPASRRAFAKAIATIAKENAITLFFRAESGDHIDLRITVLTKDSFCREKIQSHNTN